MGFPVTASQFAAAAFAFCILPLGPILWSSLFFGLFALSIYCRAIVLFLLLVGYLVWVLVIDADIGWKGSRRSYSVRSWTCWQCLADYFKLEVDLVDKIEPSGRYMVGYHPHGVVSVGAFVAFGTDGAKISSVCPGIDFRLCTLDANFKIPFIRELVAKLGIISSSRQAIACQLRKPSTAVVLVVGGAREALEARPGSKQIHLVTRKGFVREALLAQASLVPCFAFGENEVYETFGSKGVLSKALRYLQQKGVWTYGYSIPLFWGFVPYTPIPGGIQPKAQKIDLVMGKPLPVPDLCKFEDEGKLEIVFKTRLADEVLLSPWGFSGQAAKGDAGLIVVKGTTDPRAAWGVKQLERGMLLTTVDGRDVTATSFASIQDMLQNADAPLTLTFTDGLVTKWHRQYMEELRRIHDSHRCCVQPLIIN